MPTICNIVFAGQLNSEVDLEQSARALVDSHVILEQRSYTEFSAMFLRMPLARDAMIVFANGRFVVTGVVDDVSAQRLLSRYLPHLRTVGGGTATISQIVLTNITAKLDMDARVDVGALLALQHGVDTSLAFRSRAIKIAIVGSGTAVVFETGQIIFTGARNENQLRAFADSIVARISNFVLARTETSGDADFVMVDALESALHL